MQHLKIPKFKYFNDRIIDSFVKNDRGKAEHDQIAKSLPGSLISLWRKRTSVVSLKFPPTCNTRSRAAEAAKLNLVERLQPIVRLPSPITTYLGKHLQELLAPDDAFGTPTSNCIELIELQ